MTNFRFQNARYSNENLLTLFVLTYLAARYGYKTRGRFVAWSVINDSRINSLCTCMFMQFHLWVFCVLICAGFLQVYLPRLYQLWRLFHTSFIVSSVHVMRLVVPFILVFNSETFQFFLSCFLSLSNNLKPTTRITNNISETFFSLSLSLLVCSYQPRFIHKSQMKWPFVYKFWSAYISEIGF
jgi:hypothetical protein